MTPYNVHPIGTISTGGNHTVIRLKPEYCPALEALDGFSHLQIIWWFSEFDDEETRQTLQTPKPYNNAPDTMGIFATRSPIRPNPIALSVVQLLHIDHENGVLQLGYIDANDGTPVLDIKPYTPSLDRVEKPVVPAWCSHWPSSLEQSGTFDWSREFRF